MLDTEMCRTRGQPEKLVLHRLKVKGVAPVLWWNIHKTSDYL